MVARWIIRFTITIVALGAVTPVSADELGDFVCSVARDFKRRNCWPEPFIYSERDMYRQTMSIQVSAGWERQNLLSEFHFMPGGNELTEAGRIQAQWIINEVPDAHRQIYVHRGATPQETAIRMQTVQRFVAQSPYGVNVPVLESTRTDDGWPAERIDLLSRKAAAAMPDPKLMGSANSGNGAGGH